MNRRIIEKLEEHDKEDAILEVSPWREIVRRDFLNGETIVREMEAEMQKSGLDLKDLHRVYPILRQKKEIISLGMPIRTESQLAIRKHSGSFTTYYHTHDFYELLYVYRGELIQYEQKSNVPIVFKQGMTCLLAPGMIHALEPSKKQDVVFKITIPKRMFDQTERFCPNENEQLKKILKDRIVHVKKTSAQIHLLMEMLAEELLGENKVREDIGCLYLALILAEISAFLDKPEDKNEVRKNLEDYLWEEDMEATLKDFAFKQGYSADYLGRKIRKECGESFTKIRQKICIEKAVDLVVNSEISVEKIAEKLGYKSISGFYKVFEKEYGITPGEYRKMMKSS